MQNTTIPMRPELFPQQRVYEVLTLPQRPEPFNCIAGFGEVPQDAVPKNGPRSAIFLGQVEWAWSPMHNRIDIYYLHRGRRYWILWNRYWCEDWYKWEWQPVACVHHKGISEKQAAVYLLMAFWQNQAHERECDKFHWIGGEGFFSVAGLEAIAREVWGETLPCEG